MDTNTREAIKALGAVTAYRFDIWAISGRHHAGNRAIVLSKLYGKFVPQSKAGVNALRDAFYTALNITGDCLAHKEDNFMAICKAEVNQ